MGQIEGKTMSHRRQTKFVRYMNNWAFSCNLSTSPMILKLKVIQGQMFKNLK